MLSMHVEEEGVCVCMLYIIVRSRVRGSTRFRNPRPVAMVSERSEDTISTARGFINRVDPIGRVI